jgi:hypothetical protein
MRNRLSQALAIGAASAALACGIALSPAGVAAAAPSAPVTASHVTKARCHSTGGRWVRVWHPRSRDRRGIWHNGYWSRAWVKGHLVCGRR